MEKQPASYMHENWQSGLGAACEPFEFWKPRPTSAAASTTPPTLCFSKCPPLPTSTIRIFQYSSILVFLPSHAFQNAHQPAATAAHYLL